MMCAVLGVRWVLRVSWDDVAMVKTERLMAVMVLLGGEGGEVQMPALLTTYSNSLSTGTEKRGASPKSQSI